MTTNVGPKACRFTHLLVKFQRFIVPIINKVFCPKLYYYISGGENIIHK